MVLMFEKNGKSQVFCAIKLILVANIFVSQYTLNLKDIAMLLKVVH